MRQYLYIDYCDTSIINRYIEIPEYVMGISKFMIFIRLGSRSHLIQNEGAECVKPSLCLVGNYI